MKALQKLVPNASKVSNTSQQRTIYIYIYFNSFLFRNQNRLSLQTDKASMLDEVIEYLKQLQAQVQMMNNVRNMAPAPPQMVIPLGMQQQLQMALLARMGMAMGMGMLDMSSMPRAGPHSLPQSLIHPNPFAAASNSGGGPTFIPPPFMVPHMAPAQFKPGPAGAYSACAPSVPLPDPYCALLAQVCSCRSLNIASYLILLSVFFWHSYVRIFFFSDFCAVDEHGALQQDGSIIQPAIQPDHAGNKQSVSIKPRPKGLRSTYYRNWHSLLRI